MSVPEQRNYQERRSGESSGKKPACTEICVAKTDDSGSHAAGRRQGSGEFCSCCSFSMPSAHPSYDASEQQLRAWKQLGGGGVQSSQSQRASSPNNDATPVKGEEDASPSSSPAQEGLSLRRILSCEFVKISLALVFQHPVSLLIGFLVLAICMTGGILGVVAICNMIVDQRQADARSETYIGSNLLVASMETAAQYAYGTAYYIKETPGHDFSLVMQSFNATAKRLFSMLSGNSIVNSIALTIAPNGVIRGVYPLEGHSEYIGIDVLQDPRQRPGALKAIDMGSVFLSGPLLDREGRLVAPIRLPVFVNGSEYAPGSSFGDPNGVELTNCSACHGGERRFWGFATTLMNWESLLEASKMNHMQMGGCEYTFRLVRETEEGDVGPNVLGDQFVLAQSPDLAGGAAMPSEALEVDFKVLTSTWTIYMFPGCGSGWHPSWRWPLMAVVIIMSVVLGAMVAVILLRNSQLKETSVVLHEEKKRLDALLVRQYDLINCFKQGSSKGKENDQLSSASEMDLLTMSTPGSSRRPSCSSTMDKILQVRKSLQKSGAAALAEAERIEILELLGSGSFGKVYRGLWRGTQVAVKCLVMPASMSCSERAEKMAVMEAAISSSLCHPHLVQTYTYSIKPMRDEMQFQDGIVVGGEQSQVSTVMPSPMKSTDDSNSNIHGYEVRLVLEFCDKGSLSEALDQGAFMDDLGLNYAAVLDTASDVARGMLHLHLNQVLHSDLKASNVMLKSGGSDGRGVLAKVVDFGLAIKLETMEQTHVSHIFQGTPTHMAPEVLMEGKQSKAADVYAFGITLWELFTASRPYQGVAKALLGHLIAHDRQRPTFPPVTPAAYKRLAEWCWHHDPDKRPTFSQVLDALNSMRSKLAAPSRPIQVVVERARHHKVSQKLVPEEDHRHSASGVGAPDRPSPRALAAANGSGSGHSPAAGDAKAAGGGGAGELAVTLFKGGGPLHGSIHGSASHVPMMETIVEGEREGYVRGQSSLSKGSSGQASGGSRSDKDKDAAGRLAPAPEAAPFRSSERWSCPVASPSLPLPQALGLLPRPAAPLSGGIASFTPTKCIVVHNYARGGRGAAGGGLHSAIVIGDLGADDGASGPELC